MMKVERLWLCLVLAVVATDALPVHSPDTPTGMDDRSILKVIKKRSVLDWGASYLEEKLHSLELADRVVELERQLQPCQRSGGTTLESTDLDLEPNEDRPTPTGSEQDWKSWVISVCSQSPTTMTQSLHISSAQDNEATVTLTSLNRRVVYVIPPSGFLQMPLQQDDCERSREIHIKSTSQISIKLLTKTDDGLSEEHPLPPSESKRAAGEVFLPGGGRTGSSRPILYGLSEEHPVPPSVETRADFVSILKSAIKSIRGEQQTPLTKTSVKTTESKRAAAGNQYRPGPGRTGSSRPIFD